MTRTIWTGACTSIIVGAAVAAMAQTQTAQPNTAPAAEQKITVTGCLKAAPAAGPEAAAAAGTTGTATTSSTGTTGTTGTAGTAGTAGAAGAASPTASPDAKFILADATISPAKADTGAEPGAAGTTAAAGASGAAGARQTYQLIANGAALSPHVGKKLELTGTLVDQAASSSTSAPAAAGPALKVESGKVVGASCQE